MFYSVDPEREIHPAGNINLRKRGYQWPVHMLRKT